MKALLCYFAALALGAGIWFLREDEMLIKYYLYRAEHETCGMMILHYSDRAIELAPNAVPAVARMFRSDGLAKRRRFTVAMALHRADPVLAREVFRNALRRGQGWQVSLALSTMGLEKDHGALDLALRLTDHPDAEVREEVAQYLALGSKEQCLPALKKLLLDKEESVRDQARQSIKTLTTPPRAAE